ncbi:DUF3604 domain-containing protein [Vibrio variabilis]|uniref:DUF3604 domain-containing protein n=1 Tax=Vibrio variabilis TaxID=990271 RepID=UPI000DDA2EC0|nr:DUF3604 domain-containing protein [Vibrio variabilis]
MKISKLAALVCLGCMSTAAFSGDSDEFSPYVDSRPNNVYFGDTHLHTSYSTDAGLIANRLGPEEAYRFARGEEVTSSMGVRARLHKPLDFLVVSDHAENLGLSVLIEESNPELLKSKWGKMIHDVAKKGDARSLTMAYDQWTKVLMALDDPLKDQSNLAKVMWQRSTEAAEKYNEPGLFTTLIGFEWTLQEKGNNLHRNVIFRDGKDKADQIIPLSQYDAQDPEKLWDWMEAYEENTGGKLLAIPHNGNLSNGLMFDDVTMTEQKPIDREYAERRMRWEPLYEVTQMKGDSEAHPMLSPDDEFADFETLDKGSFGAAGKTKDMLPKEYAREAYKRGLEYQEKLGANPFKFGMVGSTDSHTGLATAEENNYFGKVSLFEPVKTLTMRYDEVITGRAGEDKIKQYANQISGSGLAAVWARENTREAIWDAMSRKETYATTGTRMRVRVFGGFDFTDADLTRSDFVDYAYENGVPMGGDLTYNREAPGFLIQASRDEDGANLDRIQVVKGWVDEQGESHERIYDVALSDGREIDENGRSTQPVGNTVDIENATYTNDIGEHSLETFWKDPDFNPDENAFYYVRVLEIPTPRWTTYDAKFFGVDIPENVAPTIQERAYTSPIWYSKNS